jgi:hypothetical protein
MKIYISEQRSRGAEEQRSRGAEEQRSRGAKKIRMSINPISLLSFPVLIVIFKLSNGKK